VSAELVRFRIFPLLKLVSGSPEKDKIAEQYQVPVRHIHDVLRTEIPVFGSAEDEKKFNEISQKKFIMVSTHQNLTNVFSQFKVKK